MAPRTPRRIFKRNGRPSVPASLISAIVLLAAAFVTSLLIVARPATVDPDRVSAATKSVKNARVDASSTQSANVARPATVDPDRASAATKLVKKKASRGDDESPTQPTRRAITASSHPSTNNDNEQQGINAAPFVSGESGGSEESRSDKQKEPEKTPPVTPLQPPFRIVQLGQRRTGSTFQYRLLDVLARMKSIPGTKVNSKYIWLTPGKGMIQKAANKNKSFVIKSHQKRDGLEEMARGGHVVVFTSRRDHSGVWPYSAYTQHNENLLNCSLCEVDRYKSLFGLTSEEVEEVREYMGLYEKLRRCCGAQMSKYYRHYLHGCNATKYKNLPAYPHCEDEDMTAVEARYTGHSLTRRFYQNFTGFNRFNLKEGECAKSKEKIESGEDFNGKNFTGCESFEQKYFGPHPTASTDR